ncbi:DUF421 domain-containing protein [Actinotignum sp. GS-2025b]|uniref:DUF421 domain-containing protein n=1 Tax=Actinotignum sp. GS-2025b TaxID=3427275 RepID=UPI003F46F618
MSEIDHLKLPELLGITWLQAGAIAVATCLIYLFLVVILRALGQNVVSRLSTSDMAAVVVIGAIAGRVTLGHTPTLAGGVVALLTLFCMQALLRFIALSHRGEAWVHARPVVIWARGELTPAARRHSTTTEEIMIAVRLRGVACVDDVAAVILEPNGQLSVLTGPATALDPRLLAGVKDAERI